MRIPLKRFKEFVDQQTLELGLLYFKKGLVSKPRETRSGVFESTAKGSQDYNSWLLIKEGYIKGSGCNCSSDTKQFCKHLAALVFWLEQDDQNSGTEFKGNHKVLNSHADQVEEVLEYISHEDLKDFIRTKSKESVSLRNTFLSSFAYLFRSSKRSNLHQINIALKKVAGTKGLSAAGNYNDLIRLINHLLISAEESLRIKNYTAVISVCFSVMEGLTGGLEHVDDSEGQIKDKIRRAYEILYDLTKEKPSGRIRRFFLVYALKAYQTELYSGHDWHLGMLELATQLLNNDREAELILENLDKIKGNERDESRAQKIRLEIWRTQGKMPVSLLLEQHPSNHNLRHQTIIEAINTGQYENAAVLARSGLEQYIEGNHHIETRWYNWLLIIAYKQKDKEKIVEYSRILFFLSTRHQENYYGLMKQNLPKDRWNTFVEELIKDIFLRLPEDFLFRIAKIYIYEQWWERLIQFASKHFSLDQISQYEKYLAKDYTKELITLYDEGIKDFLGKNSGKSNYKIAATYLHRMKNLGATDKVASVVQTLKKVYSHQKAFLEELERI